MDKTRDSAVGLIGEQRFTHLAVVGSEMQAQLHELGSFLGAVGQPLDALQLALVVLG